MGQGSSQEREVKERFKDFDKSKYPSEEGSTIQLKDGRKLGYKEYGSSTSSRVILFFHGTPGSRLFCPPLHNSDVRVIVLERPGYGLSTHKPGFKMGDWPNDVSEFLDQLQLQRVGLMAWSAGSPFAWACLHAIPDRFCGAVIISTVSPHDAPQVTDVMPFKYKLAWWATAHSKMLLKIAVGDEVSKHLKDPVDGCIMAWSEYKDDIKFFYENQDIQLPLIMTNIEAYSRPHAVDTVVNEYRMWGHSWGFDVTAINHPNVVLYHGKLDVGCTPKMAEYFQKNVKGTDVHFVDNMGHFVIFRIWDEAIEKLCSWMTSPKTEDSLKKEDSTQLEEK